MSPFPVPAKAAVLVVEDNPGDARLVREKLARSESTLFECETVPSIAGAREALSRRAFDAVLLDLTLLDAHGLEALVALRSASERVPIVVLTGSDDESLGVAALRDGAQDFVFKGDLNPRLVSRCVLQAIARMRAQAALDEVRARLEATQRQAHVGTWEVDLRTGRSIWSDELYRICGLEPGIIEPSYDAFLALLHPEDRARIEELTRRAMSVRGERSYEVRIVTPADDVRHHLVFSETKVDETGAPASIFGSSVDVTDLKRAHEAVALSEAQCRQIHDAIPDAILIVDRTSLSVVDCNDTALKLYGYSREELIGLPQDRLSADLEENAAALRSFEKEGRRVFAERQHRRKDGSTFAVDIHATEFARDGRSLILSLVRDVTARVEARRQLEESEGRFRRMAESISQVFWMTDESKTRMLYVSPAYEAIWGRPCADLYREPKAWLEAIVAEDRERVLEALPRQTVAGGFDVTYRILRPDGAVRWIRDRAYPMREPDGRMTVAGVAEDVTEQCLAETRLRRSEASLTEAQKIAGVGSWTLLMLQPGMPLEWSAECYAIFGLPNGTPMTLDRFYDVIHPDDRPARRAAVKATLESGAPLNSEYRIFRADGQTRWVRSQAHVIRDEAGCPLRVTGVIRDITESRAAEERLRRSETLLEEAQEIAKVGSWSYSLKAGEPLVWSRETYRQCGVPFDKRVTVEDFIGLVHPRDRETVTRAIEDAIIGGKPYDLEMRIVTPAGDLRWIHARGRVLRDEKGRALEMVGTVQEITERVRAQLQLRATELSLRDAQKMDALGRLAGGIAHDFNNLLTAILGAAELSLAELPKEHPVAADLSDIRETSLRAAKLTQQLLAFSRRQFVEPKVLDLGDTVASLAKMLRRLIGEDVALAVRAPAGIARAKCDSGQLEQLVVNLVVNARDAMPHGGAVEVVVRAETLAAARAEAEGLAPGRYAVLLVRDTGVGMSEDVRSHIFEPFFTTKERGKGTGLGLATCYGIVKQNGGAISCETTPGKGTTFVVRLPIARGPVQQRRALGRHPVRGGSETVLVVEDEASVRKLVVRVLKRQGYGTIEAADGKQGLARVRADKARRISLIVTDTVMPRMSGKRMADLVRKIRPEIRVLFTSGYTDDVILREGVSKDEIAFLRKPFTSEELSAKVRETLQPLKRRLSRA